MWLEIVAGTFLNFRLWFWFMSLILFLLFISLWKKEGLLCLGPRLQILPLSLLLNERLPHSCTNKMFKKIWKLCIPPRVRFFLGFYWSHKGRPRGRAWIELLLRTRVEKFDLNFINARFYKNFQIWQNTCINLPKYLQMLKKKFTSSNAEPAFLVSLNAKTLFYLLSRGQLRSGKTRIFWKAIWICLEHPQWGILYGAGKVVDSPI